LNVAPADCLKGAGANVNVVAGVVAAVVVVDIAAVASCTF